MIRYQKALIGMLSLLTLLVGCSGSTEDVIYPPNQIRVLFNVGEEVSQGLTRVSVLIQGNGYQPKYSGSHLTVNGMDLSESPLSGRGVSYVGQIPRAGNYEFIFSLANGQILVRYQISGYTFPIVVPNQISRGNDFLINHTLSPEELSRGRYLAEIKVLDINARPRPEPRLIVIKPQIGPEYLTFTGDELGRLPLGTADFSLVFHENEREDGIVSSRYTIIYRSPVMITD